MQNLLTKFTHATGLMLGAPESAVIETTNRCNLDCIMCYRREYLKEAGDMDFDVFKQIAQRINGARHICCHGGENRFCTPGLLR